MSRTYLLPALMLLIAGHAEATGQTQVPLAGSLQTPAQRVDRYYDQRQAPLAPASSTNPLPNAATADARAVRTDVRFVLNGVRFDHSAFIDEAALQALAKPYIGHEIGADELNHLVAQINAIYTRRGITTARAVLGRQALSGGIVHIELVEGHLGQLDIRGNQRTHDAFVRRRIHTASGALLDTDQLRRDLVYINRTSSLRLVALLRPGSERGLTDVQVQVTEPASRSLDAFVDNAGVDTSGRSRLGLQGHYDGLLGVGDRVDLSVAKSRGGTDGLFSYGALVNERNGRLGVSYSRSQIDIISGPYRALDIVGHSSVTALQYDQPFIATQAWLLTGSTSASQIRSSTSIDGTGVADNATNVLALGLSVNHRVDGREWALTQLVNHLNSSQPIDGTSTGWTAVGNFGGAQRLGASAWLLRADAGWQWSSSDRLASSSLFQIGGPGSVRGYERGVLAGTEGYYANLELHWMLPRNFDAYAFGDHGAVFAAFPKARHITGGGLGLIWRYHDWLSFNGDIARALDKVVPNQDSYRVDFRLAAHWD
jgi:hemolysin activation/secretion protein